MIDDAGHDPHVDHLLGLYYLDSLEPEQGDVIEGHLDACRTCRDRANETIETVAALALIDVTCG